MATRVELVPVDLGEGGFLYLQATVPAEQPVAESVFHSLDAILTPIRELSGKVLDAAKAASPDTCAVELGFGVTVKAGKLVALLAEGSGTASIKVTLTWSKD